MQVTVRAEPRFQGLLIGFSLVNAEHIEVLSSYFDDLERTAPGLAEPGVYDLRCTIPAHLLQEGLYRLIPDVSVANEARLAGPGEAIEFAVTNVRGVGSRWQQAGWRRSVVLPYLPWATEVAALPEEGRGVERARERGPDRAADRAAPRVVERVA